jgi:hypothetical protein
MRVPAWDARASGFVTNVAIRATNVGIRAECREVTRREAAVLQEVEGADGLALGDQLGDGRVDALA